MKQKNGFKPKVEVKVEELKKEPIKDSVVKQSLTSGVYCPICKEHINHKCQPK